MFRLHLNVIQMPLCRYLAPEYAESGIVSVRTDVYAFGVVLLQLISGRKVLVANEEKQSIRQWVCSGETHKSYHHVKTLE